MVGLHKLQCTLFNYTLFISCQTSSLKSTHFATFPKILVSSSNTSLLSSTIQNSRYRQFYSNARIYHVHAVFHTCKDVYPLWTIISLYQPDNTTLVQDKDPLKTVLHILLPPNIQRTWCHLLPDYKTIIDDRFLLLV